MMLKLKLDRDEARRYLRQHAKTPERATLTMLVSPQVIDAFFEGRFVREDGWACEMGGLEVDGTTVQPWFSSVGEERQELKVRG